MTGSDTERSGELERFAIEHALYAAWKSELWIPADPDYGFIDYFEAAATRNLSLLHGFEELAEDVDRRGIVPQSNSDQAKLVTDGGQSTSGTEQNDFVFKVPAHPNAEEDHFIRYGDGSHSFWESSDRAKDTTIISWDESETPFGRSQDAATERDGGDDDGSM